MTDALTRWCPPPDGTVPWDALDAELSWVRAMRDCPQDPIHHAEGNVWIHTRMVLEALVALPRWRALPTRERELVFAACLLHDIAKPWTTQVHDDGRVTARGHSAAGAIAARRVLWDLDVDPADREAICGLETCFWPVPEENPLTRPPRVSLISSYHIFTDRAESAPIARFCLRKFHWNCYWWSTPRAQITGPRDPPT